MFGMTRYEVQTDLRNRLGSNPDVNQIAEAIAEVIEKNNNRLWQDARELIYLETRPPR